VATFRGLAAVGSAVLAQLDDAWERDPFTAEALATEMLRPDDLENRPVTFGVTLYVYRVAVNGTQRTHPPAVPGRRRPLPVEMDFVLSTWAASAEREIELLGWCMRVLDDEPLLTAATLNRSVPGVFAPSELVEVVPNPLPLDDFYRLWDALPWPYQLSAAYTARVVRLESTRTTIEAGPVLERDVDFGVARQPALTGPEGPGG
jgi:hypothetical protein